MSGRTVAQVAGITALTAVTGLLGYAIYFDYQRRNNPEFRKGISEPLATRPRAGLISREAAQGDQGGG
jgi:import receptor subunit TOM20